MLEGTRPLFRAGSIEFQTKHLLVIAVLALAFSCALIMRFYPIKYGYYLNEFDPYFDYRATKFIVDNGLNAYWQWHDTMSWYPEGRDVPGTSQSVLHITGSIPVPSLWGRHVAHGLHHCISCNYGRTDSHCGICPCKGAWRNNCRDVLCTVLGI